MSVTISTTAGYLYLESWVFANIIQLETQEFCSHFLNINNDPCGRQYDQMTQAARSVTANIAEGSSRHQTSRETEMKLVDVARASISELSNDYLNFLLQRKQIPLHYDEPKAAALRSLRLDKPEYTNDLLHEAAKHILKQKARVDDLMKSFTNSLGSSSLDKIDSIDKIERIGRGGEIVGDRIDNICPSAIIIANSMLILCGRLINILRRQLEHLLADFKQEGGFTENMTQERLAYRKGQSIVNNAPKCPQCGKPMVKRVAQKGINSGHEFWSCSDFPACRGTRPI